MIDINKAKEILENYFANVTPEEFARNLREYCPELFEAESIQPDTDELCQKEMYQQAKEEIELEIAPKLLLKGMSAQEVAELLELDISCIVFGGFLT